MSLQGPIICIEDDEDDQLLIEHSLRAIGVISLIRFFPNGPQAIDYLEHTTESPFLVLCDINMPILNGLELRRQINASAYLSRKSIPFVFLTTGASPEMVREAYDQMVQGFYQKAPTVAGLQMQLRQIVDYWQGCLHPNSFDE